MDTVILLCNFTLPCLWRFDPTFDNDVQGESVGWNILEQTPIHSKFHNNLLLDQSLDTMGLGPNLALEDILIDNNIKIKYLRKTCGFCGM